ncbi:cardiomyopathy-associated protein [Anaeramoeba flamelloides]|uniref:Cardiomyopathy-associated protein n=1 Tax=Anaeramoeba flamelloides TaxID=1746091 RepID=A0AAV8A701_9EUKA|nr:cardiomyopathy-associated protein [Anaeramoeba flamelloides]
MTKIEIPTTKLERHFGKETPLLNYCYECTEKLLLLHRFERSFGIAKKIFQTPELTMEKFFDNLDLNLICICNLVVPTEKIKIKPITMKQLQLSENYSTYHFILEKCFKFKNSQLFEISHTLRAKFGTICFCFLKMIEYIETNGSFEDKKNKIRTISTNEIPKALILGEELEKNLFQNPFWSRKKKLFKTPNKEMKKVQQNQYEFISSFIDQICSLFKVEKKNYNEKKKKNKNRTKKVNKKEKEKEKEKENEKENENEIKDQEEKKTEKIDGLYKNFALKISNKFALKLVEEMSLIKHDSEINDSSNSSESISSPSFDSVNESMDDKVNDEDEDSLKSSSSKKKSTSGSKSEKESDNKSESEKEEQEQEQEEEDNQEDQNNQENSSSENEKKSSNQNNISKSKNSLSDEKKQKIRSIKEQIEREKKKIQFLKEKIYIQKRQLELKKKKKITSTLGSKKSKKKQNKNIKTKDPFYLNFLNELKNQEEKDDQKKIYDNVRLEQVIISEHSSFFSQNILSILIEKYLDTKDRNLFENFFYLNYYNNWKRIDLTLLSPNIYTQIEPLMKKYGIAWIRAKNLARVGSAIIRLYAWFPQEANEGFATLNFTKRGIYLSFVNELNVFQSKWSERHLKLYIDKSDDQRIYLVNQKTMTFCALKPFKLAAKRIICFLFLIYNQNTGNSNLIGINPKVNFLDPQVIDTTILPNYLSLNSNLNMHLSSWETIRNDLDKIVFDKEKLKLVKQYLFKNQSRNKRNTRNNNKNNNKKKKKKKKIKINKTNKLENEIIDTQFSIIYNSIKGYYAHSSVIFLVSMVVPRELPFIAGYLQIQQDYIKIGFSKKKPKIFYYNNHFGVQTVGNNDKLIKIVGFGNSYGKKKSLFQKKDKPNNFMNFSQNPDALILVSESKEDRDLIISSITYFFEAKKRGETGGKPDLIWGSIRNYLKKLLNPSLFKDPLEGGVDHQNVNTKKHSQKNGNKKFKKKKTLISSSSLNIQSTAQQYSQFSSDTFENSKNYNQIEKFNKNIINEITDEDVTNESTHQQFHKKPLRLSSEIERSSIHGMFSNESEDSFKIDKVDSKESQSQSQSQPQPQSQSKQNSKHVPLSISSSIPSSELESASNTINSEEEEIEEIKEQEQEENQNRKEEEQKENYNNDDDDDENSSSSNLSFSDYDENESSDQINNEQNVQSDGGQNNNSNNNNNFKKGKEKEKKNEDEDENENENESTNKDSFFNSSISSDPFSNSDLNSNSDTNSENEKSLKFSNNINPNSLSKSNSDLNSLSNDEEKGSFSNSQDSWNF